MGIGGVTHDEVTKGAQMIGCKATKIPFKYLGVMVGDKMNRIHTWDLIINKVVARLSKWKVKILSIGGRFTLTKSVLSTISLYYFLLFKVPKEVLKRLESCRSNFFHGMVPGTRKVSWFSWDSVVASKEVGGLGFKVHPEAMWVSIIKAIHRPCGNLDMDIMVALNKLPTGFNMSLRGLEVPSIDCPVCHEGVETFDHLFFSCSVASSIEARVLGLWGLPNIGMSSYHDWLNWFNGLRLRKETEKKNSLEDTTVLGSFPSLSTPGTTMVGNASGKSSYANVTGKSSGKKLNFRTLFTPGGNGIDVVVPGRLSYARAMIELRADVELKDNIVVAMPKIIREGHYTCAGKKKTMKKPSQTSRGVPVGPKMGFKPHKEYRPVPKNSTASSSGNKKKGEEPTIESSGTTPIIEKIRKFEDLLTSGQAILVDKDGNPLKKVEFPGEDDSEDEVASVDNDMARSMTYERGFSTQSLLEQWRDSYGNGDYNDDPYDDDMYEGHDLSHELQAICDNLDIRV
ncbi:RNA-directed DNA polymerase, eukaryota, reverse transcriptase zinc-binding domain protein [Tanacetum coccineum]